MVVLLTPREEVQTQVINFLISEISHIATGTGTTPFTSNNTTLESETYRDAIVGTAKQTGNKIRYKLNQDINENNGVEVNEIGTFNASSAGDMYSRSLLQGFDKTINVDFTAFIEFTINI